MKIERLFHEDEKVLWKGKIDGRVYLKQAFLPDYFPIICIWAFIILMIDFVILATRGIIGLLFSSMSVLSPILLLPFWTNYGLYLQKGNEEKGMEEDVEFVSYDKLDDVTVYPAKSRANDPVGDLCVTYRVETMDYASRSEIRMSQIMTLRKIHAPEQVAQMIREQQLQYLEFKENQLALRPESLTEPQSFRRAMPRKKYTVLKPPVVKCAFLFTAHLQIAGSAQHHGYHHKHREYHICDKS